jgi:fumarate hydratase class II
VGTGLNAPKGFSKQVNDTAFAFSGSQGNLELNAMRPIVIKSFLHSLRSSLTAAESSGSTVEGTELNVSKIGYMLTAA